MRWDGGGGSGRRPLTHPIEVAMRRALEIALLVLEMLTVTVKP